jgi:ABC-2 type transport system ATP-binding protein
VREIIECVDLTKKFGKFVAVDRVNFAISRGEVFGFLGPNGAGKSTTIRMICGILKPTSGKVYVDGEDVWKNPEKIRRKIGYMSQKFSLYNDLTVEENINFYSGIYGISRERAKERKRKIIEIAGLEGMEKVKTSELSGAYKQRLAFGLALIHEPEIVFLDEPTSGVDPLSRRKFWEMIYSFSRKGLTFFVTTHFVEEAENCQKVAFINNGRIVAIGSPQSLKENLGEREVYEIECSKLMQAFSLLQREGWGNISIKGNKIRVLSNEYGEIEKILDLLKKEAIDVLSYEKVLPTLEEVFVQNVKEAQLA